MGSGSRARADSGSFSLELVVLVPLLLLVALLLVQTAVAYLAHNVLEAAADVGVEEARKLDGSEETGRLRAAQVLEGLGQGLVYDARLEAVRGEEVAEMRVTAQVVTVLPGVELTVSASSTGVVERLSPLPSFR